MGVRFDDQRARELMRLAVDVAGRSVAEPGAPRPSVGAVLADADGRVLLEAHRGEVPKQHAEYRLLEKAREQRIGTSGCVLFATLEPCTRRGEGKVPCAERVHQADLARVYIGTLDPNPNITGRGQMLLSLVTKVSTFPMELADELTAMNRQFFDAHRDAHVPGDSASATFAPPALRMDRNGLLHLTLDLVSGEEVETIWVRAGDLSWWREAQITFLEAVLRGRDIRILCTGDGALTKESARAAAAIGIEVRRTGARPRAKGTFGDPRTERARMVLSDTGTRTLLRASHDEGVLSLLADEFEREWDSAQERFSPSPPTAVELDRDALIGTLREHVPMYADARLEFEELRPDDVLPMTRNLEAFKSFRIVRLEALRRRHGWPPHAAIKGSPWPITPPVVERREDGLVVIDGTHRFHRARLDGDQPLTAIVVSGCAADLPAVPLDGWGEVREWHTKRRRTDRYEGYREELFRPVRDAFERLARRVAFP